MNEDIKKRLECAICQDTLKEPKQLKCIHVFCRECIDTSFHKNREGSYNGYKCPICRQETVLSSAGAHELNDTPLIVKDLIDVVETDGENKPVEKFKEINNDEASKCPHHPNEKVEFLCKCNTRPLCKLCQDDHKDHDKVILSEVINGVKDMQTAVDREIHQMRSEENDVKECLKILNISHVSVSSRLNDCFKRAQKNKETLEKNLEKSYEAEKAKIGREKTTLSKALDCANSIRESISNIQVFAVDSHTLSSWEELKMKYEKLKESRLEKSKIRKCIYTFVPENPNHLKFGKIQKTKARVNVSTYGIMQRCGKIHI